MKAVELLKCLALASLCLLLIALTGLSLQLPRIADRQADAARAAILTETHIAIVDFNQQLADAITMLDKRTGQALSEVHGTVNKTDARTGEALSIIRILAANADEQATGIRRDVNGQLTTLNTTLATATAPLDELASRYQRLPDEIRADREYQGLVAETMGVLGATKVTMGQAAITAKVIAMEAPKMTAHIDSVAGSIEREADQLTAPKTFWAQLRTWLLTLARIYGAI